MWFDMSERAEEMEAMAKMEEDYAVDYDKNVEGLGNIAITGLMRSVSLDSMKHAGLYRTIATIIKGSIGISDLEYDTLEETLRKHIEVETKMMKGVKSLMEGEQDERVKFLLNEIYLDEARHHKFLSNLLEAVLKKDMIFDEEIWDQLWRDVPTHGAPSDPFV
jgi:rubrerythrin